MPSFARASLLASFNKGVDGKSFNICFNFVRYDDIEPIDVNTDQRSMASQPHPQPSQPQISDSVPGTQPKKQTVKEAGQNQKIRAGLGTRFEDLPNLTA